MIKKHTFSLLSFVRDAKTTGSMLAVYLRIETTVKKREQITALTLDCYKLINNIRIAQAGLDKLKSDKLDVSKGIVNAATKQAILDLYYMTKWNITRLIYLQDKALQFLDPAAFTVTNTFYDQNIKDLLAQQFNRNTELLLYYTKKGKPFKPGFNKKAIVIDHKSYPISMRSFIAGRNGLHTLDFRLDPRTSGLDFYGVNIKANSVLVLIKGAQFENGRDEILQCHLTHSGMSTVYTKGESFSFLHPPFSAVVTYKISKNFDMGNSASFPSDFDNNLFGLCGSEGNNCSLGISPFSCWHLELDEAHNDGISLSKVTAIEIYFKFYFQDKT